MTLHSKPPKTPLSLLLIITLALCLMSALSGCSTQPAKGSIWSVPAEALAKSEPLPLIPVDADAKDDDPSDVDLAFMAGADLTITKMYRALAKRHDQLVDAVIKKLQEQAR